MIRLLLCLLLLTVSVRAAERPPNIVFILADDLGYADLGCYGAAKIRTPHLDRLAAEGARFASFYAAATVCTPTRAALMTGCYPKRVGLHVGVISPRSGKGLHPQEVTIAEVLRERGYATGCVGKWHLGEEPEFLPTRQGFQSYFGMPGPNHGISDLFRGEERMARNADVDRSQLTQRLAEEAVGFIRENRARPFFLYFAHPAPHTPLYASEKFRGKSAAGLYGDMIEETDWSVGRVLETLRELDLERHTLVVFTSDNGQSGVAAPPLHGGKGSTWEAGHRVPCIARLPGRIPAGSVRAELCATFDWTPTLAALAGTQMPPAQKRDGRDLWPILSAAPGAKSPHETFIYYSREGAASAIRDANWKLHVVAPVEKWAGKLPPAALLATRPSDPPPWLFDLETDIGETRNVAAANPEIVARLRHALEERDTELSREARPIGSAK